MSGDAVWGATSRLEMLLLFHLVASAQSRLALPCLTLP